LHRARVRALSATRPHRTIVRMHCLTFSADARFDADFDQTLLREAAAGAPVAAVWQAQQSLVVPRTYRKFAAFEAACQASAARGWPVVVRQSGGGLVPQGGGIVNFSLAQARAGSALSQTDAVYSQLCDIVASALRTFGIASRASAVPGAFCDGRYNLAVETATGLRKIAGTAQLWRRVAAVEGAAPVQVVLAHAVILADGDAAQLTQHLNAFEAALGSGVQYQPGRVVSLRELCPDGVRGLGQALVQALSASSSRV